MTRKPRGRPNLQWTRWDIGPPLNTGQSFQHLLCRNASDNSARAARNERRFGTWRHEFGTETTTKHASGSWDTILTSTKPE